MADFAQLVLSADTRGLKTGETALNSLAATGAKTEAALKKSLGASVPAAAKAAAVSLVPVESAMAGVGAKAAGTSNSMRMLGQQLSQVAQQGAVTGNYLGALAVQLPDMALGFGSLAIAASVVATVALPLVTQAFGDGKSAADALAEANDALGESIGRLRTMATTDLEAIRAKYGEVDAALLQLLEHQRENETNLALSAAKDAVKAVADEYGVAAGQLNIFRITGKGAAAEVAESMGLSKDAFLAFQQAIQDARNATTFEELADATARVEGYLNRSTVAGTAMAGAVTDAALAMREADTQTKAAEGSLTDAATAAATLAASGPQAGWLAGAIGDAATLASTLWNAASAAAAAAQKDATARTISGYGGRPEAADIMAQTDVRGAAIRARMAIAANNAKTTGGGGGGGGGGSGSNEQLREAEQLYASTRTEAEKYEAEVAKIDALLAGGYISAETYSRALKDVGEKYGETSDAAKAFEDAGRSAFVGIVTGAESAQDAIANLLDKLAEMLANEGFNALMNGITGDTGGSLLAGIGKLFSFEGGGGTGNGPRSGGMDGKGGYLAMVHPKEHITDLTTRSAVANVSSAPVFHINVVGATGNREIRQMVEQGINSARGGLIRQSMAAVQQANAATRAYLP